MNEPGPEIDNLNDGTDREPAPLVPFPALAPAIQPLPLPVPLTSLVDREAEIAAVAQLLSNASPRLVTLTGPGGVGKTRIAIVVATELAKRDQFPDGVAFVPLASLRQSDLAPSAIAHALGIRELDVDRLAIFLASRHLLLVLDNLEHLPDAAPIVSQLLVQCANIRMLVTSRAILNISGEQVYPIAPLPLPEADTVSAVASSTAVLLFVERAASVVPAFTLSDNAASDVAAICRRLDGLPLAIELAAARIRLFTPSVLNSRLRGLALLDHGPRDQPPRLRSLRDAISWSYDLLSPTGRQLFRELAVFDGPIPYDGASAVSGLGSEGEFEEALEELVEHSLLQPEPEAPGGPWFKMLETIREYGVERLAESGRESAVRDALVAYLLFVADEADKPMSASFVRSPEAQSLISERLLPEFRRAIQWLIDREDHETALNLVNGFRFVWWYRNRATEGRAWLDRTLKVAPVSASRPWILAAIFAAMLAATQGDHAVAEKWVSEALRLAIELDNKPAIAFALRSAGQVAGYRGDETAAIAFLRKALEFETSHALPRDSSPRYELGLALIRVGELDEAQALIEEALSTARETAVRQHISLRQLALGTIARIRGNLGEARDRIEEALSVAAELRDNTLIAEGVVCSAGVALTAGHLFASARLLGAADAILFSTGRELYRNQKQYLDLVADTRNALGDERYLTEQMEGAKLAPEEAMAQANSTLAVSTQAAVGPPAPYGLSRRELEVLRLVAEGLSDKEIGETLGISRRTASKHVETILSKLDVPSRTAAATYATRHGLI